MSKKPKENVEENVDSHATSLRKKSASASRPAKKKTKYKKGPFPYTVKNTQSGALYVRKSVTVKKWKVDKSSGEKTLIKAQDQIWRVVEPPTAEQAKTVLQDVVDYINTARSGKAARVTNFAEVASRFCELEAVPARYDDDGRKVAGRRSLKTFKHIVELLTEAFGHLDVHTITYGDLEDYKALRLRTPIKFKNSPPRQRSIRSVNYELTVLKQIFNFAYRRRWLDRNPFNDGRPVIDKAAERRRNKIWTRAEEAKALALCTGKKYAHMKPVILCLVDGGFRRGELLHSKWSEVSFETGTLQARSYKGKSLHKRTVHMTRRMMAALIEWKILQKEIKTISDKSLVIGYANLQSAWETIREKINREDLRLHDLRHVFGTRLNQSQKVSLREIQLLLGHSDIRTTQLYLNPSEENLKESIKVLEED